MSMMTRAATMKTRSNRPRAVTVIGVLLVVAGLTGLLLLHIQLRFAIKDLKMESRAFQKRKVKLESQLSQLTSRLEELKRGERVFSYARETLGMVPYEPSGEGVMLVDSKRLKEWRECDIESDSRRRPAETAASRGVESVEKLLNALKARRDEPQSPDTRRANILEGKDASANPSES